MYLPEKKNKKITYYKNNSNLSTSIFTISLRRDPEDFCFFSCQGVFLACQFTVQGKTTNQELLVYFSNYLSVCTNDLALSP